VNIFGRIAALGNGGHGEVFTTRGTVSTGPDPVDTGASGACDGNLSLLNRWKVVTLQSLTDCFEHLVCG
jgi:hypothetical protein